MVCLESADRFFLGKIFKQKLKMHSEYARWVHIQRTLKYNVNIIVKDVKGLATTKRMEIFDFAYCDSWQN